MWERVWVWVCEWDSVKRPQYRFLTPVTTYATCSLNFDKFPVYIFDAFLIRYLPHSIFLLSRSQTPFTKSPIWWMLGTFLCVLAVCCCCFFVCVCVFGCVLFYGNGSMIAMKDIFNKVLPAFFFTLMNGRKKLYSGSSAHLCSHSYKPLQQNSQQNACTCTAFIFCQHHAHTHTHTHIHIHTVKSLLSSFLCRMRLR